MTVKVFNLMSGLDETRLLVQDNLFKCKCGLNQIVHNSKQKWNHGECRCKCKEFDNWRYCKNDYMWKSGMCDCEFNKTLRIDEYLDIKKCSCEKCLIAKLVLECEHEILNTTETSLDDKKEIIQKR